MKQIFHFLNLEQDGKIKITNLLLYLSAINAIYCGNLLSTAFFGMVGVLSIASDAIKPKENSKIIADLSDKISKLQKQMAQTRMQIGLQRGE